MAVSKKYKPKIKKIRTEEEVKALRSKRRSKKAIKKIKSEFSLFSLEGYKNRTPRSTISRRKAQQIKESQLRKGRKTITTYEEVLSDMEPTLASKYHSMKEIENTIKDYVKKEYKEAVETDNEAKQKRIGKITDDKIKEFLDSYEEYTTSYYRRYGELPEKEIIENLSFKSLSGLEKMQKFYDRYGSIKEFEKSDNTLKTNFITAMKRFGMSKDFIDVINGMDSKDVYSFLKGHLDPDYAKAIFDYDDVSYVSKEERRRIREDMIIKLKDFKKGKYFDKDKFEKRYERAIKRREKETAEASKSRAYNFDEE